MKINKVFSSIQGEGQRTGFPCVFLRLYGCNMRCSYCDTMYAVTGKNYKEHPVEEIFEEIESFGIPYVCITGGEPLLQRDKVFELSNKLFNYDYLVEINTNGSFPIWRRDDAKLRWVVDYKLPSSGMWKQFDWSNIARMTKNDDLMFVIQNRTDYDIAKENINAVKSVNAEIVCNFSPCWGKLSKQQLIDWIIEDRLVVRFNLQLHKVIYGPTKRGV